MLATKFYAEFGGHTSSLCEPGAPSLAAAQGASLTSPRAGCFQQLSGSPSGSTADALSESDSQPSGIWSPAGSVSGFSEDSIFTPGAKDTVTEGAVSPTSSAAQSWKSTLEQACHFTLHSSAAHDLPEVSSSSDSSSTTDDPASPSPPAARPSLSNAPPSSPRKSLYLAYAPRDTTDTIFDPHTSHAGTTPHPRAGGAASVASSASASSASSLFTTAPDGPAPTAYYSYVANTPPPSPPPTLPHIAFTPAAGANLPAAAGPPAAPTTPAPPSSPPRALESIPMCQNTGCSRFAQPFIMAEFSTTACSVACTGAISGASQPPPVSPPAPESPSSPCSPSSPPPGAPAPSALVGKLATMPPDHSNSPVPVTGLILLRGAPHGGEQLYMVSDIDAVSAPSRTFAVTNQTQFLFTGPLTPARALIATQAHANSHVPVNARRQTYCASPPPDHT